MRRYLIHDSFNIYEFTTARWEHPVHNHTYFEIIFIVSGAGKHHLNGNTFSYRGGDVFFLGPEDYHSFDIPSVTQFCYIRFHESYTRLAGMDRDKTMQKIVRALLQSTGSFGPVVIEESEKQKLQQLLSILRIEYANAVSTYYELIRDQLMKSIFIVLSRNLTTIKLKPAKARNFLMEDLVLYIRAHISSPSALTVEVLSEKFNYSSNYLSIFFKKQTGEALKQYIVKERLKLVEARLLYSQMTLSSIATELGFCDESHLCKLFKKYNGVSPAEFRNKA